MLAPHREQVPTHSGDQCSLVDIPMLVLYVQCMQSYLFNFDSTKTYRLVIETADIFLYMNGQAACKKSTFRLWIYWMTGYLLFVLSSKFWVVHVKLNVITKYFV